MRGGRTQRCALRSALPGPLRGLRPQIVRRRTFELAERAVDDLRKPPRSSGMPTASRPKSNKGRAYPLKVRNKRVEQGRIATFRKLFENKDLLCFFAFSLRPIKLDTYVIWTFGRVAVRSVAVLLDRCCCGRFFIAQIRCLHAACRMPCMPMRFMSMSLLRVMCHLVGFESAFSSFEGRTGTVARTCNARNT